MYKDPRLLDWEAAIARGGPTWLEIVASHAHLLSAIEDRNDTQALTSTNADQPSHRRCNSFRLTRGCVGAVAHAWGLGARR